MVYGWNKVKSIYIISLSANRTAQDEVIRAVCVTRSAREIEQGTPSENQPQMSRDRPLTGTRKEKETRKEQK